MLKILKDLKVPKVLLRHIMMNYLDFNSIKIVFLNIRDMRVLTEDNKQFLSRIKNGFNWCCENGYLNEAKWIYYFDTELTLNQINDSHLFCDVCGNGHLHIAKWLYSIGINIYVNYNNGFRRSCENGHLDISKWLYSIGIDLDIVGEKTFLFCCVKGNLESLKWLYSIGVDFHKFEMFDLSSMINMIARTKHGYDIYKWIESTGIDVNKYLY